jgi:hypothetical protein
MTQSLLIESRLSLRVSTEEVVTAVCEMHGHSQVILAVPVLDSQERRESHLLL